jgi:nitroreductase
VENSKSIQKLIKDRWSPRAMSGEPLSDDELMPLFEAARWAPSSYNGQPWRFVYGKKGTPHFTKLFNLLVETNQVWTKNAAVLVLVVSRKVFEHNNKPAQTHSYDTGAAWENLALEGCARGLVIHGLQGFDYKKAETDFSIPSHYQVEAMIAIGKKGSKETLSQALQSKEHPQERKPLKDIIEEGSFSFS